MSEALLSRFDVAYQMVDEGSAHEDAALSRHIIQRKLQIVGGPEATAETSDWAKSTSSFGPRRDGTLEMRCRAQASQQNSLPQELLSTYLRYARTYSFPRLGNRARERIKAYYLERKQNYHKASGQLPVTPRLLEALVRLSEARARAELRRDVLLSDVEDVIEIIDSSNRFEQKLPDLPQRKGKTRLNALVERLKQAIARHVRCAQNPILLEREIRQLAGESVPLEEFEKA